MIVAQRQDNGVEWTALRLDQFPSGAYPYPCFSAPEPARYPRDGRRCHTNGSGRVTDRSGTMLSLFLVFGVLPRAVPLFQA